MSRPHKQSPTVSARADDDDDDEEDEIHRERPAESNKSLPKC